MTWTLKKSEKELQRKTWIDKAIDKRISQKAVADKIRISERQLRRLLSTYREKGEKELVSGTQGQPGNRRLKTVIATKVKKLISAPLMIAPIKQWTESS
jgi:transposase